MAERTPASRALGRAGIGLGVLAAGVSGAVAMRLALDALTGRDGVSWVLGRASGLGSYVLLLALVTTGLVLSHPWSRRLRRPGAATRLAMHSALATFTLVFVALHVVVLATDPWAQVGQVLVEPFGDHPRLGAGHRTGADLGQRPPHVVQQDGIVPHG